QGPDWPCSSATPPQGRNFILTCLPPYRQSVISGNIGSLLFRLGRNSIVTSSEASVKMETAGMLVIAVVFALCCAGYSVSQRSL
ncbi:MAG: hypothetical protein WAO24_00970, partial [Peptococcia bacterium]